MRRGNNNQTKGLWLILLALLGVVYLAGGIGALSANFVDTDPSTDNRLIIAGWGLQTTQSQFEAGVLSNVSTTVSPGDVKISLVANPTLITSDNTEVSTSTSGATWDLIKTLNVTKSGSSYNTLRIDTNLKSLNSWDTVYSSIRLNGTEIFSHSTSSTTYVNYQDVFDFSGYADGSYSFTIYLQVPSGTGYNSLFGIYSTNPVLITSDNSSVSHNNSTWTIKKTLSVTKDSSAYNTLRFDTNLWSSASNKNAGLRIAINGTTAFEYLTKSTSAVSYSDAFDFSGYANGTYTMTLLLYSDSRIAYNSKFEIYRSSPGLITSDNTEKTVSAPTGNWQLMKTLLFTKSDATYNELRVDTNLHATSPASADISIRVDDVEKATHNTSSTTYVSYSDTIDVSALTMGNTYSVKLWLNTSNGSKAAYNSLFEVYRTKTYATSGTLASQVYDSTTTGTAWKRLNWTETLASGTDITFAVRASNTLFTKSDASPTWVSLGSGNSPQALSVVGRYFQWRATLTTSINTNTPTLSDVTVYYPTTT